ncbi:MAG: cadherin-like domain-containing protein, partial [Parvibaculales bacterium]
IVLKPFNLLASDIDNANAEIIFTVTTAAELGTLKLDGVTVGILGTFTMADIIAGKVTYEPGATPPADDTMRFTYSDGTITSEILIFNFDVRARTEITQTAEQTEAQTVTLDLTEETASQEVITDDSQDEIIDGSGDDYIETGTGDDVIALQEDGGDDTIAYNFDGSGDELVGTDGNTRVSGFTRGEDKILFKTEDTSSITTLDAFLKDGQGTPDDNFADDKFIITVDFDILDDPENVGGYVVAFSGITFHFRESAVYGGNKLSMPVFEIAFDEPLTVAELLVAVGGRDNLDPVRGVALKTLVELDAEGNVTENYVANILGADSIDFTQEAATPEVV